MMTDEEQAVEVGKIVLNLKAEKRKFVCLKNRAVGIAEKLESAAQALRAGHGRVPVEIHHHDPEGPVIEHEAHWMRAEEINNLIEEIENTTKKVASLQKAHDEI